MRAHGLVNDPLRSLRSKLTDCSGFLLAVQVIRKRTLDRRRQACGGTTTAAPPAAVIGAGVFSP